MSAVAETERLTERDMVLETIRENLIFEAYIIQEGMFYGMVDVEHLDKLKDLHVIYAKRWIEEYPDYKDGILSVFGLTEKDMEGAA